MEIVNLYFHFCIVALKAREEIQFDTLIKPTYYASTKVPESAKNLSLFIIMTNNTINRKQSM